MNNWAGNYEFSAARIHEPRSVDEVREILASAKKVRPWHAPFV